MTVRDRDANLAGAATATYQDVLDAPPNMVAEIVGGSLYTHPRPASPHLYAETSLAHELAGPFGKGRSGPGGWWTQSHGLWKLSS